MAEKVHPSSSIVRGLVITKLAFTDVRLGRGADATVFEVEWNGTVCAAKRLHDILLEDESPGGADKLIRNFEAECLTWSKLRHPGVVQFLGVYFERSSRLPVLIMERMDTSLRTYLENHSKEEFPLRLKVFVLRQVTQALAYLHNQDPPLVHHDLSSNNVLLNVVSFVAKVSDFGMSRAINPSALTRKSSIKGTLAFMAPEALHDPPQYTMSLDVFSFGNVILTALTHEWPSPGPPTVMQGGQIVGLSELQRREHYIAMFTAEEKQLFLPVVCRCLENQPDKRPSSVMLVRKLRYIESSFPAGSHVAASIEQLHQQLSVKEKECRQKDEMIREREEALRKKDKVIREKEEVVRKKDEVVKVREEVLKKKDEVIREREEALKKKDKVIWEKEEVIRKKDEIIRVREEALREKDDLQHYQNVRITGPGLGKQLATAQEALESPHEHFEVMALYEFQPNDNIDLPLAKGQRVTIINSSKPNWWRACNECGEEGYVPSNYVKKVGLETEEWYFPDLTRVQAEQVLKEESEEGRFIIRPCHQNKGYKYALSIFHEGQVRHYRIKQDEANLYWISEKHHFSTIGELVQYHKSYREGLVTRLRRPSVHPVPNQPSLSSMFGDKWEVDKKDLQLGEELGSGQFGHFVKGTWKSTVKVAIKMMKEGAMNEEEFVEEAQIMTKLQHPNVVTFYGVCTQQRPIYIVTELMEHGCLLTYIQIHKEIVNKTDVLIDIANQICSAMEYMEARHFIHRDVATRNCLVGRANTVKLVNFEMARYVAGDEYIAPEGSQFAIKWSAPEALLYYRFSSKSDVWSYGILLWELFTAGKTPYPSFTNPQVFEEVLKGYRLPKPTACQPQVYQLMRDCWEQGPDDRPSFQVLHTKLMQLEDQD